MTRKEMEEVIEGGGSVLHDGRLHTRLETLPSKAALASSAEDKATVAADLDAQIARLQAERAALQTEPEGEKGAGNTETKETVESLTKKHNRGELADKAAAVGIEVGENDTKAQIAEAIVAKGKE